MSTTKRKQPETVKWRGRRYKVAFITKNEIVLILHKDECWGQYSRMPIPRNKP
jgi:hypothetical protein